MKDPPADPPSERPPGRIPPAPGTIPERPERQSPGGYPEITEPPQQMPGTPAGDPPMGPTPTRA